MVIEIIKFENQASFVENFGRSDTDDSPAYFVLYVKGYPEIKVKREEYVWFVATPANAGHHTPPTPPSGVPNRKP